jgi:HD-GYP domain-containing protein (c-di-GMP phosphodiesterase class II)
MESKSLAVADIVEAMASHRPYRAALGLSASLDEISRQRGISLDAEVVDACLRICREEGYHIEA